MARVQEVASLIKAGRSLTEIRSEFGISLSSVKQYLYSAVVEGLIRRSDIVFTIPAHEREFIEDAIRKLGVTQWYEIHKVVVAGGLSFDSELLKIYLHFRDARVSMGDMYEYLSDIEVMLHRAIKMVLVSKYGKNEWWRQGIPLGIRKICVAIREEDSEPAEEPYHYTNLIHLQEILDKQWELFSQYLPPVAVKDKKGFLSKFIRLNRIRNSVMHPVKGLLVTEDDFIFVRVFHESIVLDKWQIKP